MNYVNSDWYSNKPDIHPTKLISHKYIDSDYCIYFYTDGLEDHLIDKDGNTYDTKSIFMDLESFWKLLYKTYSGRMQ